MSTTSDASASSLRQPNPDVPSCRQPLIVKRDEPLDGLAHVFLPGVELVVAGTVDDKEVAAVSYPRQDENTLTTPLDRDAPVAPGQRKTPFKAVRPRRRALATIMLLDTRGACIK